MQMATSAQIRDTRRVVRVNGFECDARRATVTVPVDAARLANNDTFAAQSSVPQTKPLAMWWPVNTRFGQHGHRLASAAALRK